MLGQEFFPLPDALRVLHPTSSAVQFRLVAG
jgi:hypothetical protein